MALQFAPAPTFSQPQSLVPEIKVQPVARQNVRTRDIPYRDRQQEKDERRDMLLALALGAGGGELIGKGLTSLIGKIPGVDKYFEDVEVSGPVPGATRADFEARARQMGLGPVETKAFVDASVQAEAIPEYSRARPAQTRPSGIKTLLEKGLSLAPAAALKTAKGVETFGDLYGRRQTAQATAETTKASNLQKAEEKLREQRAAMVRERSKAYLGSKKSIMFYGINPRTGKQITRNGYDVEGDRFVISLGEDYDRNIAGDIVPRGEVYLNPILTSDTNTENRAQEQSIPLYSAATGEISMGYNKTVQEGARAVNKLFVMRPGGREEEVTGDNLWFPMSAEQTAKQLKDAVKESNSEVTDLWADYADAQKSVIGTLQLIQGYQNVAAKNPGAMTTVAGIQAFANDINANLQKVQYLFDNDMIEKTFRSKNSKGELIYNAEQLENSLALKRAADAYYEDPNNPDKQAVFLSEFKNFRGNVNDTYASEGFSLPDDFTSANRETASARARLLATQLQLAYRAAATEGQTGRTLSDKDLANFLKIVGYGSSQDLSNINDQLNQFGARIIEQFDSSTNTQIHKMQEKEEELERYLRTVVEIDQKTIDAAKNAENELARQEVLDQLSKASTNVANQFFKYEEQEDGTYKLVIPKFEQNYNKSDTHNAVLNNIKNYRENRSGASSSSTAPTGTGAARSPVFRLGIQ